MVTRASLTEQIQRLYGKSTNLPISHKQLIRKEELDLLVNQIADEMLSISVKESIAVGDIVIPSCMIATYPNNTVSAEDGRYFAILPVYPITLRRNIGVFSVIPQSGSYPSLTDGSPFIPITQEDWDLLRATDEGLLEDQTGFYVEGRKVFFTKTVSTAQVNNIALSGTSGTANVTVIGGLTKLVTFNTSLTQTAADFVTSHAAAYAAVGITVTSSGVNIIFTAAVAGTPHSAPVIANATGDLAGVSTQVTANVIVAVKFKLLISDLALIGDNEPYPISKEMEAPLIARALEYLIKK